MTTYPTGYSNQTIDFSRASQALLQTALQDKVNEVKQRKAELDESEKYILKSLDLSTIPELSGSIRNRFDEQITAFGQDVKNLVMERKGSLRSTDKAAIEKGYIELQNSMNLAKNTLGKIDAAQKILRSPKAFEVINTVEYGKELGQLIDRFNNGEDVGSDVAALPLKYAKVPSTYDILAHSLRGMKFNESTTMKYDASRGLWTSTNTQDEAEVRAALTGAITDGSKNPELYSMVVDVDPFGNEIINKEKVDKLVDENIDKFIQVKKTELKPTRSGSGGGVYNPSKDVAIAVENTTTPSKASGVSVKLDGTSKEREYGTVIDESGSAYNLGNVKATPQELIAGSDGKLWLKLLAEGGMAKRNGEQLYSIDGSFDPKSPERGFTESELIAKSAQQQRAAINALIKSEGKEYKQADDLESDKPRIERNQDGSVDVVFKARETGLLTRNKNLPRKEVRIKYLPAKAKTGGLNVFYKEINSSDKSVWLSDSDLKKFVSNTNVKLTSWIEKFDKGDFGLSQIQGSTPTNTTPITESGAYNTAGAYNTGGAYGTGK